MPVDYDNSNRGVLKAMGNSKLRVTPLKAAIFAFAILVLLLISSVSSMYLFPYSSVQIPSTYKNVSEIGANKTTYGVLFILNQLKCKALQ